MQIHILSVAFQWWKYLSVDHRLSLYRSERPLLVNDMTPEISQPKRILPLTPALNNYGILHPGRHFISAPHLTRGNYIFTC